MSYKRYKGASGSSAVCSFTMDQVEKAFNGRYREVNRETQQWYTYNHPVPEPRPGAVSAFLLPSAGKPSRHILHMSLLCTLSLQLHEVSRLFPFVTADRALSRYLLDRHHSSPVPKHDSYQTTVGLIS